MGGGIVQGFGEVMTAGYNASLANNNGTNRHLIPLPGLLCFLQGFPHKMLIGFNIINHGSSSFLICSMAFSPHTKIVNPLSEKGRSGKSVHRYSLRPEVGLNGLVQYGQTFCTSACLLQCPE
ncbi:hypothetical protein DSECCO2_416310 [anaerobic digester metagenome]